MMPVPVMVALLPKHFGTFVAEAEPAYRVSGAAIRSRLAISEPVFRTCASVVDRDRLNAGLRGPTSSGYGKLVSGDMASSGHTECDLPGPNSRAQDRTPVAGAHADNIRAAAERS